MVSNAKKEHKLYSQVEIKELNKAAIRFSKIMTKHMTDSLARR